MPIDRDDRHERRARIEDLLTEAKSLQQRDLAAKQRANEAPKQVDGRRPAVNRQQAKQG